MHKPIVIVAATAALLFASLGTVEAAVWSGASNMKAAAENYPPVEQVQTKSCPTGFRLICGASGRCRCVAG
jgi:hypothetical protein